MDTNDRTATRTGVSDGDDSRFLLNAAIGAVAAFVLSFIPFSTFLGGMIAGYLEGGDEQRGAYIGAVVGLILFAPVFLLLYLVVGLLVLGGAPSALSGLIMIAFLFVALYTVGAALLGGVLGAYLARELDRNVPILDDL